MGVIEINPFNPDQVLFTTGYGIWSWSMQPPPTQTNRHAGLSSTRGLEETVPLALISPPEGAHLLSGVGDIDGFQHDNLTDSPPETFAGPHFGNTEDLSFAWEKPQVMARTGTASGHDTGVCAAYSLDDGTTWTAFANDPADDPSAGSITISADGAIFVWTPRRNPPYFTLNYGTNWIACKGLATGFRVVADTVNPSRFYAYDSRTGKLLVSTNGAADFSISATTLPAVEGFGSGFGGDGGVGATLYATSGREGDLWIVFRANGLYHSAHGGMNFTKVEGVQEASSLGFGKAAPGNKYPALLSGWQSGPTPGYLPLRRRRTNLGAHQRRPAPIRLDQSCHRRSAHLWPGLFRHRRSRHHLRRPGSGHQVIASFHYCPNNTR